MRVIWVFAVVTGVLRAAASPPFYRDVVPILEQHYQGCTRKTPTRLVTANIETLVKQSDVGAPVVNVKDAPKPLEFTGGWNISKSARSPIGQPARRSE